jgi:hypothetical protein
VGVVKALLRFVSYVFHGLLALGLLALSGLAFAAGAHSLHLDMLPWTGSTLLYVLLLGSAAGLLILILALRGQAPWLFFLWSLVVAGLIVKCYFLSGYRFHPGEAKTALYLAVGSLIALVGAWFVMTRRRPAR